jgi:hypothetical protein
MPSKRCILMKYSMLIRCEKCGYENFPQHRFCGMCAAALPFPKAPSARANPEPPPQVPKPVSRPSPAAVEREPVDARSVSYLLEDEPAPSHRGRYVLLLILLVGAVAAAGWHWREDLVSLVSRFSSSAGGNTQPNSSAPAGKDSTSEAAPATSANAGTQVEKPSTGASGQVDAQAPAAQTQTPPSAAPSAAAASGAAGSTQSLQPDQSQPSNQSQPSDSASTAAAAKPADSGEAASQPAPARKSPRVRAQPATTSASRVDELEAEGERYLYGNGVRENCARARTNLLAAAQHSNAQAQNVLGTMYATGHCATRDLPTAYRWFGRSLRQDPSNTRIEQDLKVLWKQMTPEERKLALRDER